MAVVRSKINNRLIIIQIERFDYLYYFDLPLLCNHCHVLSSFFRNVNTVGYSTQRLYHCFHMLHATSVEKVVVYYVETGLFNPIAEEANAISVL